MIGIAIFLTTLLLFMVPTIGNAAIKGQMAAVKELYPPFHALILNTNEDQIDRMMAHHEVEQVGRTLIGGKVNVKGAQVGIKYVDEVARQLYRLKLKEGKYPEEADEILVTAAFLRKMQQEAKIGEELTLNYQIRTKEGFELEKQRSFRVCGLMGDEYDDVENQAYAVLVSKAWIEEEIELGQASYMALLSVKINGSSVTTWDIEDKVKEVITAVGIKEDDMDLNRAYLGAMYVDPSVVSSIVGIMVIIVFAGIITIYSIYYVGMNSRIQEFGRLRAIGTTKRQLRSIVLWEGWFIAFCAIPVGIFVGLVATKFMIGNILKKFGGEDILSQTTLQLFENGTVSYYSITILILAVVVSLVTVYLSLLKPMRIASKVSEIEALRYQGIAVKSKSKKGKVRRSYFQITIPRLCRIHLKENRKTSRVTILSMSITGILLVVVGTILSCMRPKTEADDSILGEYSITLVEDSEDKQHPERAWKELIKDNPLSDELEEEILQIPGVMKVEVFDEVITNSDVEPDSTLSIMGVGREYAKILEDGIVEGNVDYDQLRKGNQVILNSSFTKWCDAKVGDRIKLHVHDASPSNVKEVTVVAIGDYPDGLIGYDTLITSKEVCEQLSDYDVTTRFNIYGEQKYDQAIMEKLEKLCEGKEYFKLDSWKQQYDDFVQAAKLMKGLAYAFLGVLSAICIMNLINTMINSIHIRKKEIGMMQAIGMTKRQLRRSLGFESLYYTLGTLLLTITIGSVGGYFLYRNLHSKGWIMITSYVYPWELVLIIVAVMSLIQWGLTYLLSRSVKKESLIERIRYSD